MIRRRQGCRHQVQGIPRESGDDPTAASILVTTGAYSLQEWE